MDDQFCDKQTQEFKCCPRGFQRKLCRLDGKFGRKSQRNRRQGFTHWRNAYPKSSENSKLKELRWLTHVKHFPYDDGHNFRKPDGAEQFCRNYSGPPMNEENWVESRDPIDACNDTPPKWKYSYFFLPWSLGNPARYPSSYSKCSFSRQVEYVWRDREKSVLVNTLTFTWVYTRTEEIKGGEVVRHRRILHQMLCFLPTINKN
jgi:hypothetical protein